MTTEFPAPESFALYECDIDASNGVMDNLYGAFPLPTEVARQLIPAGTELAEQSLTAPGFHPVFMFFTHNKFGEPPEPAAIHYREMLVGIPFVKCKRALNAYTGTYTYMPRLYINQDDPRIFGNIQFGYEKLAADITDDGHGHFEVRTPIDGCFVASATASNAGVCDHPGKLENIARHADLFHQPLLTQASRRTNPDIFTSPDEDEFLVSWIDYEFDHPTARATPITMEIDIGHLFTPAAFPRKRYSIPSIATDAMGAFRIEVRQHVFGQIPIADFDGTKRG